MQLQIKKVNVNAVVPTRNNADDSGLDLYACLDEDVVIQPAFTYELAEPEIEVDYDETINGDLIITKRLKKFDLHTPTVLIPTGIAIKLPESYVLDQTWEATIRPRSGLASKHGISCHLGTIDNGYIGELKVLMYNFSDKPFTVTHGMKIAQLVIAPVFLPTIELVDELADTSRGVNGFGSSGV